MSERVAVVVAAGVVSAEGKILAARRKAGTHLERRWEFPGGKLEPNEAPQECLIREFREELDVGIEVGKVLEVIFHRYPERNVLLMIYDCRLVEGEPRAIGCEELLWIERKEAERLDWLPANRSFVRRLASESREPA